VIFYVFIKKGEEDNISPHSDIRYRATHS